MRGQTDFEGPVDSGPFRAPYLIKVTQARKQTHHSERVPARQVQFTLSPSRVSVCQSQEGHPLREVHSGKRGLLVSRIVHCLNGKSAVQGRCRTAMRARLEWEVVLRAFDDRTVGDETSVRQRLKSSNRSGRETNCVRCRGRSLQPFHQVEV